MPTQVLVKDEKYEGRYVALKSFTDRTVVGAGKTPLVAQKKARAAGVSHPVILFVPRKNVVQIY